MQQVSTDLPKVIAGKTVDLRRPSIDDLPYIRALWADPETMKDVGGPIVLTDEKARQWYARMVDPGSNTDRYFLICGRDGAPVGEASFHRFDRNTVTAELNIKIEFRHRFHGHGPEALQLLLDFFFNQCGGEAMIDPVALHNTPGQRALKRFGFIRRGTDENAVMMEMTKQRFQELYEGRTAT